MQVLREKLNCSQEQLGFLIKRNRNKIKDFETGHRYLSQIEIASLNEIWQRTLEKDKNDPTFAYDDLEEKIQLSGESKKYLESLEKTLSRKSKELDIARREHEATKKALSYLIWMMANPGTMNENQLEWLRYLQDSEIFRLEKVGLIRQAELEIKIAKLKLEIAMRKSNVLSPDGGK